MDTNRKGNISEAKVLNAFVQAGCIVWLPFGNGVPYDLIIDINDHWANEFEFEVFLESLRKELVEPVGLEPTTSAMPSQRSAKLSYSPTINEQRA